MNKFNSRRTYLSTYPLSGHYIHLDSLSLSLSLSLQSHAKKFLPGFGDGLRGGADSDFLMKPVSECSEKPVSPGFSEENQA